MFIITLPQHLQFILSVAIRWTATTVDAGSHNFVHILVNLCNFRCIKSCAADEHLLRAIYASYIIKLKQYCKQSRMLDQMSGCPRAAVSCFFCPLKLHILRQFELHCAVTLRTKSLSAAEVVFMGPRG